MPSNQFYPTSGDPIIAFVKHNEPLGVRVYLEGEQSRCLPEKLHKLLRVDLLIEETLREIEEAVAKALWEAQAGLDTTAAPTTDRETQVRRWSIRVSVFSPFRTRDGVRKLCPTQYRWHREPLLRRKGNTEYAIVGARIEGPLAKAYQSDHVQVLHRLPSPSDDLDRYVAALATLGIDRPKVQNMSRRPRAFLCFPFGLKYEPDPLQGPFHQDPEGVVCIDLDDELAAHEDQKLEVMVQSLRVFFNNTLSAFWRLRTS